MQGVQGTGIQVQDHVIQAVEGQVDAARRIADALRDGAGAEAGNAGLGNDGLCGQHHHRMKFLAAVISSSRHLHILQAIPAGSLRHY